MKTETTLLVWWLSSSRFLFYVGSHSWGMLLDGLHSLVCPEKCRIWVTQMFKDNLMDIGLFECCKSEILRLDARLIIYLIDWWWRRKLLSCCWGCNLFWCSEVCRWWRSLRLVFNFEMKQKLFLSCNYLPGFNTHNNDAFIWVDFECCRHAIQSTSDFEGCRLEFWRYPVQILNYYFAKSCGIMAMFVKDSILLCCSNTMSKSSLLFFQGKKKRNFWDKIAHKYFCNFTFQQIL